MISRILIGALGLWVGLWVGMAGGEEALQLSDARLDLVAEGVLRVHCPPAFELSCGVADMEYSTGLFQDGVLPSFRWVESGTDLGPAHCFLERTGAEVRP